MKLKEKISLEKVFEKEYKTNLVELESNKEAIITHFLHNNKNGVSGVFKNDAIKFTKEILEYKSLIDLGVPFGRAFRSNLFVRSSQKGFPLQSLTQLVA